MKTIPKWQPTLGFQRVLQRAVFHVQSSGKKEVTSTNVLVAIFSEKQSQAVYFMSLQDITRLDVREFYFARHAAIARAMAAPMASRMPRWNSDAEVESSPLELYASNLNQLAIEGKIDPADRSRDRNRAHRADPLQPAQEQPAVRW